MIQSTPAHKYPSIASVAAASAQADRADRADARKLRAQLNISARSSAGLKPVELSALSSDVLIRQQIYSDSMLSPCHFQDFQTIQNVLSYVQYMFRDLASKFQEQNIHLHSPKEKKYIRENIVPNIEFMHLAQPPSRASSRSCWIPLNFNLVALGTDVEML